MAHEYREMSRLANELDLKFEADQEHEEDQAKLGRHGQDTYHLAGEQVRGEVRENRSHEAGSEKDAGNHLADDPGLAHPGQEEAERSRCENDDGNGEEDPADYVVGRETLVLVSGYFDRRVGGHDGEPDQFAAGDRQRSFDPHLVTVLRIRGGHGPEIGDVGATSRSAGGGARAAERADTALPADLPPTDPIAELLLGSLGACGSRLVHVDERTGLQRRHTRAEARRRWCAYGSQLGKLGGRLDVAADEQRHRKGQHTETQDRQVGHDRPHASASRMYVR